MHTSAVLTASFSGSNANMAELELHEGDFAEAIDSLGVWSRCQVLTVSPSGDFDLKLPFHPGLQNGIAQ